MRKLRCLLGLHGPWWTNSQYFEGPYSRRTEPFVRICPHCYHRWWGEIVEARGVRTVGGWRRVTP